MKKATFTLHKELAVSKIDPRMYGSFIEHLGRAIYTGIYEPGHPRADEDGFRLDVLEMVRELNVPIVRYPGGNFVSTYRWEDGVGPVGTRPARLDPAWRTLETNRFGTNEFCAWAAKARTSVMMAVNLATRGVEEAGALVEYCNHPSGSYWSDLRVSHGVRDPHGIKLWCLGNEMDGPWQFGQRTADEYGFVARESAKLMKQIDPTIETVIAGSSGRGMASCPQWEATILEHAYDYVDYVSIHTYINPAGAATPDFLAKSMDMEAFIKEIAATCDFAQAKKRGKKRINLSFDEWNVWDFAQDGFAPWTSAPGILEENYTMRDALAAGMMLNALLRNADRVKIACLAQLVNVIAPIRTEPGGPAWRQTIFYPYLHGSIYGRGTALRLNVSSPGYETKDQGHVPYLDAVAVLSDDERALTLFAVNRDTDEALPIEADARYFEGFAVREHVVLENADIMAANSAAGPDNVKPHSRGKAALKNGVLAARLPKASWNVIRMEKRD